MSEKRVNKRIRKILEQDLAEAVADVLRVESMYGPNHADSKMLEQKAERLAQTLGRFEASVRQGPPPPTPAPSGGAKWGAR